MQRQTKWKGWGFLSVVSLAILLNTSKISAQTTTTFSKEAVSQQDQKITLALQAANTSALKKKYGWFPKLSLGVNLSLAHAMNVPGVDDGIAFSLGVVINGSLLYLNGPHEWKTDLTAIHTQTKTPTIEPFVKTADNFDLKTFYIYRFKNRIQLGLLGGLQINTALFPTNLVVAKGVQYVNVNPDGTKVGTPDPNKAGSIIPTKNDLAANTAFNLTGPFNPFIFKQMLGVTARPYEDNVATLNLKASLVAQEVWAKGLTLQDDATTPELELRILQDYIQFGMELNVNLAGSLHKRVTYEFNMDILLPFVASVPTKLSGFELMNADISFKVGVKLVKWASLDYVFRAQRIPLLTTTWQVTNNLVLNVKADFL